MITLQPPDVTDFSEFYRDFVRDLVAFLMLNGARFADAAEVAQDTMTKAYQRWSTINHPKAWARRVAYRGWAHRMTNNKEDPVERIPELGALLPSSADEEAWISQHDLLSALDQLPPRQREVMAWTIEGYLPHEIAIELGITAEAARSNLKKARDTVIRYFGDQQ